MSEEERRPELKVVHTMNCAFMSPGLWVDGALVPYDSHLDRPNCTCGAVKALEKGN